MTFKKIATSSVFLVIIFTLFSFFIYPGQEVLKVDQLLYLPSTLKILDSGLYSQDYFVNYSQASFSIYDEFLAWIFKIKIDPYLLIYFLNLIFRLFFFLILYQIIRYFIKSKPISLLTLLVFLNPLTVYWAIDTYTISLHPRLITLTFCLFYLLLSFKNKSVVLRSVFISLGLMVNAITTLPFLLHFVLSPLIIEKSFKPYFKKEYFAGYLIILSGILYLTGSGISGGSMINLNTFDSQWLSLICQKTGNLFVAICEVNSFAYFLFLFSCLLLLLFHKVKDFLEKEQVKQIIFLIGISFFCLICHLIFAELLKSTFALQLHLTRGLYFLKIISIIMVGLWAKYHIFPKKNFTDYLFLISLAIIFIYNEYLTAILLPPLAVIIIGNYTDVLKKIFRFPVIIAYVASFIGAALLFSLVPQDKLEIFRLATLGDIVLIFLLSLVLAFLAVKFDFKKLISYKYSKYLTVVIIVMILFQGFMAFKNQEYTPEILKEKDFNNLCLWVKATTAKDSLFHTLGSEKFHSKFRIFCARSIYFGKFDGVQAFVDRDFSMEWLRRESLVQQMSIVDLMKKEQIDYLNVPYDNHGQLSEADLFNLQKVFENNGYAIYKLK